MNTELSTFSPGTWEAWQVGSEKGTNYWRIRTAPPESGLLDTLRGYCGEAASRLIVGAPDLLAACKSMLETCGGSQYWNGDTHESLKLIEAAIAKATVSTSQKVEG